MTPKLVFTLGLIFSIFENFSSSKVSSLSFAAENHRPRRNGTTSNSLKTNQADNFLSRMSKTAEDALDCSLGSSNSSSNCSELFEFSKKPIDRNKEKEIIEDPASVLPFLINTKNASFYNPHANSSAIVKNIPPEATKTVQHGKSRKKRDTRPPKKRRTKHESIKRYQLYPLIKTPLDGSRKYEQSDFNFPGGSGHERARYKNRNSSNIRKKAKKPAVERFGGGPIYFRAADETASSVGTTGIDTSIITIIVYGTTPSSEPMSTAETSLLQEEPSQVQQNEGNSTNDQVETEVDTALITAINETETNTEQAETGQPAPGQPAPGQTETDGETEENTANGVPEVNYHYHFHHFGVAVPPKFPANDATANDATGNDATGNDATANDATANDATDQSETAE